MKDFNKKNTEKDFQKALTNYMQDLEHNMHPLENHSLFNQRVFRAKRMITTIFSNFMRKAFIYTIIFLLVSWIVGFITFQFYSNAIGV